MSDWMEPLQSAVLAIPGDIDKKTIIKHVNAFIKERNVRNGIKADEAQLSKHKLFIDLWCKAYEAKFGEKYAFMGGKDGECVKRLLAFGLEVEHLMRVAKAAWEHPKDYFCKSASSITGFMSRLNEIRAELNAMRKEPTKSLPPYVQLQILRDMKDNHVCNQNSVAFDESKMTVEARKEYAEVKKKIMELEATQRKRALG